jgi:hypothetical protein
MIFLMYFALHYTCISLFVDVYEAYGVNVLLSVSLPAGCAA